MEAAFGDSDVDSQVLVDDVDAAAHDNVITTGELRARGNTGWRGGLVMQVYTCEDEGPAVESAGAAATQDPWHEASHGSDVDDGGDGREVGEHLLGHSVGDVAHWKVERK